MAEIRHLPSVTRILALECGGNSAGEWAATTGADVQRSYGLVSGSEWTGVPLSLLLAEAGCAAARVVGDCRGARCLPDDAQYPVAKAHGRTRLLAYGQNGEAMRPAKGTHCG